MHRGTEMLPATILSLSGARIEKRYACNTCARERVSWRRHQNPDSQKLRIRAMLRQNIRLAGHDARGRMLPKVSVSWPQKVGSKGT